MIYVKQNNQWSSSIPFIKFNGLWRYAKYAWANISGDWKLTNSAIDKPRYNRYETTQSHLAMAWLDTYSNYYRFTTLYRDNTDTDVVGHIRMPTSWSSSLSGELLLTKGFASSIMDKYMYSNGDYLCAGNWSTFGTTSKRGFIKCNNSFSTTATLDISGFNANLGNSANNNVRSIYVSNDESKIVIGGEFTSVRGISGGRIFALNSNGTNNTTMNSNFGTGFDNTVNGIFKLADESFIVYGAFTSLNGSSLTKSYITKFSSAGVHDSSWNSNVPTLNGSVTSVVAIGSTLYIAGKFTTVDGNTQRGICSLNSDGTINTNFNVGNGLSSSSALDLFLTVSHDNKLLFQLCDSGGSSLATYSFNGYSYTNEFGTSYLPSILKINTDGSLDNSFFFDNNRSTTRCSVLPDNRLLCFSGAVHPRNMSNRRTCRGFFLALPNGQYDYNDPIGLELRDKIEPIKYAGGSNANGMLMTYGTKPNSLYVLKNGSFKDKSTFTNNPIYSITPYKDNKFIVAGNFTVPKNDIVILNDDATIYDGYVATLTSQRINYITATCKDITSDSIFVGGTFTVAREITCNRFTKLINVSAADQAFILNNGVGANDRPYSIVVQPDNKILVGGVFTKWNDNNRGRIIRLNPDGTEDTTFAANCISGANGTSNRINHIIYDTSDNSIYLFGLITRWNSVVRNGIVKLNSDGTEDSTWGTANYNIIDTSRGRYPRYAIKHSTGKWIVVGNFTTVRGATQRSIMVFNSDWSNDENFLNRVTPIQYQTYSASEWLNFVAEDKNKNVYIVGEGVDTSGRGNPQNFFHLNYNNWQHIYI